MTTQDAVARPSPLRVALQVLLVVAAVIVALWALNRSAAVVLVLIAAAMFAYVIAPLVQLAETPIRVAGRTRRLPRAAAIGLVYALLAGSAGVSALLLIPSVTRQAVEAAARIPTYVQSGVTKEQAWSRYYERLRMPLQVRRWIDQAAATASADVLESVRESITAGAGKVSIVPWLAIIPVMAFFLLKDASSIRRTIILALPFRLRLRSHRLFDDLNATLVAYVRAQLLACVLVATLCGLGFALIGLPYAVLLGLLAGPLEFIPLIGPFLLAVMAATVGALHAPATMFWTIAFLAVLRVIEDYVIYPRLIRRGLELHPLAVIVGVMAGAELAGVAGMFLAVPVVAIATVVVRHWILWRTDDRVPGAPELEPVSKITALVR